MLAIIIAGGLSATLALGVSLYGNYTETQTEKAFLAAASADTAGHPVSGGQVGWRDDILTVVYNSGVGTCVTVLQAHKDNPTDFWVAAVWTPKHPGDENTEYTETAVPSGVKQHKRLTVNDAQAYIMENAGIFPCAPQPSK